MLIKQKDMVIGEVFENVGSFQASMINWFTGERKYIGDFKSFEEAKVNVTKMNKNNK